MKSWKDSGNSKKDLKSAVEVPEQIMDDILKLQNALCDFVYFKNPKARATSIYFFQKTYTGLKENDPNIIFYIVAALHLSSKVFDDARSIQQFIEGLEHYDKELTNLLPALSTFANIDTENRQTIISKIINAENDIIYRLDFHFNIPLPFNSAKYVSRRIAEWHIPPDRENTTGNFAETISKCSYLFLNALVASHLFYKYPHDMVGTISVFLACEIYNLFVPAIVWNRWVLYLLPFYEISEVKQAYNSIKKFFQSYMIHQELKLNRPIEEIKKRMSRFYITPLEDYREIDELCPPPPLNLMEEIAGEEDSFNHMWTDHLPFSPPPEIDLLTAMIPKNTSFIPRQRCEFIHSNNDVIECPQFGITLPPKPIIPPPNFSPSINNPIGFSSPGIHTPEEIIRSGSHTPQQPNFDGQRRGRYQGSDFLPGPNMNSNSGTPQHYKRDSRDFDGPRKFDGGRDFFNFQETDRIRDGFDRYSDRQRSAMRSARDTPRDQYRDQNFGSQDFQERWRKDDKHSKSNFIPPPPPPPPSLLPPPPPQLPPPPFFLPNSGSRIEFEPDPESKQSPSPSSSSSNSRHTPLNYPTSRSFSQDFAHNRKYDDKEDERNREYHEFRDRRGDFNNGFNRDRRSEQYNKSRNDDRSMSQQNYDRPDFNNRNRDRGDFNRDRDRQDFNRDRNDFNKDRDRPDFNKDRDRGDFNKDRDRGEFNRDRNDFNKDGDRGDFSRDRDRKDFNRDRNDFNKDRADFNKDRDRSDFNKDRDRPDFNKDRDRGDFNKDRDRPDFNKDRDRGDFNKDRDRQDFNKDRDRGDFNKDRDRQDFNKDRDRGDFNRGRPDFNNRDRDHGDFNRDRSDFHNRDRDHADYRDKERRDHEPRQSDFHQRQADDRKSYHKYDREHNNKDKRNQNQFDRDSKNSDRKRANPNNSDNNY